MGHPMHITWQLTLVYPFKNELNQIFYLKFFSLVYITNQLQIPPNFVCLFFSVSLVDLESLSQFN